MGANRIPDRAASDAPSAHASAALRAGRAPVSVASAGSSTAARMATPVRLRRISNHSPSATRPARAMVMSWSHGIPTPRTSTRLPSKNASMGRRRTGSQMNWATPTSPSSRPRLATSVMVSDMPWTPRMSRATPRPNMGARIPSVTASASGADQPQSKRSCQYTNAPIMAMAPWAKLNTPVVVYVRTRPLATMA